MTSTWLGWKESERCIAFWSYKIAVNHLKTRTQGQAIARGLVNLVNRTWERRAEVEPDREMHRPPGPMAVYELLPQTNCRVWSADPLHTRVEAGSGTGGIGRPYTTPGTRVCRAASEIGGAAGNGHRFTIRKKGTEMFKRVHTQTTLVTCPDCGQGICLEGESHLGRQVTCPNCDARLVVIETIPARLDWVYEEWDVDDLDW